MKSKSVKYNVTPLAGGAFYEQPLRIRCRRRDGFTLIEILVSVTIIATIVSMVYGSYFATAKSADAYKAKMTTSGQTQKVLRWMAQQIRCSYVGKVTEEEETESAGTDSSRTSKIKKSPIMYFSYEPDAPGSGTLHLVTTHMLFCEDGYTGGLVDIAYKFDKNSGTLSLSQRRFVGTPEKYLEDRNWRPLLENVESVELEFFDGRQWLKEWDFELKKKIPAAVKIGITSTDENGRKCHYGTIAYMGCSGNSGREILSETLVGK
ncbi:MAG: type II secretion system protein GspJ [Sedimentisphaerales bacterium]|nr:type II secretion system protein GspJ [Sedimentisphaerales bacterium]